MKKIIFLLYALTLVTLSAMAVKPPIYIAFQWHMHQPIYWPGETVKQTIEANRMSYSLLDVFTSRTGPYTNYAPGAVNKLTGFDHAGAQVSFSGSLMEDLNVLEANGMAFSNWKQNWTNMISRKTSLGHQRLDMVGFGYYHPLMPLIDSSDIIYQIEKHKSAFASSFPGLPYSKGFFPPENAFEEQMIPSLVKEGFEWVMVDNSHIDRSSTGSVYDKNFSIVEPNKADQLNADPGDWVKLTGLYAPGKISAAWGHRPHWMKYVDPTTGKEYRMIAMPASFLYGNEDGRGGFGALQYDLCMSQLESYNTDPAHPIIILLHHDGDNYGGGSSGYYGSNFDSFVSWLQANPSRFVCTTVQDYLDQFPPAADDVIHVEAGSWYGAGADPEFLKWNGDPGPYSLNGTTLSSSYSPDRNSWGVITAASNIVKTAQQISATSADTKTAFNYLAMGETSCYWYWDGTEDWDSHPTRASNLAVTSALNVMNGGNDETPPSIYHLQREPYNPGETEWLTYKPSDFTIWTYVFDISGLASVKLKYRTDKDGNNPVTSDQNETYAGGPEVNDWQELPMTKNTIPNLTSLAPLYKADEYSAQVKGIVSKLVDYYVEAIDTKGNIGRSYIFHTWVGNGTSSGTTLTVSPGGGYYQGGTTVTLTAEGSNEPVSIYYTLDGTTPTTASTMISSGGTVAITQDQTTLKAIAIDNSGVASAVSTNTYFTVQPTGITIKFQKPAAWSLVFFYAWTGTSTAQLGAWPGTAITLGADGWYSYTFDGTIPSINLVFSNGSGSQSVDVTGVTANTCFTTTGISGGKYTVGLAECLLTELPANEDNRLDVFPNPATDKLVIRSSLAIKQIELLGLSGNVVRTFGNQSTLSLSGIAGGMYFLRVTYVNNRQKVERVVKL